MENNFKIFSNQNFGEIRTVYLNGATYFVANDVAKSLGYSQCAKAIRTHCKGVSEMDIPTSGGKQKAKIIPESDIYRLITHSKLPAAQQFEHWIFDEVLPSIRKTGTYSVKPKQSLASCIEDLIIQQATLLKELRLKVEYQEQRIDNLKPTPFAKYNRYHSCETWLKSKKIPYQKNFILGFSHRCARYSRQHDIPIEYAGKAAYAVNSYREDVLEICFGNNLALVKPKETIELRDYLGRFFNVFPRDEREAMLKCFSQWHFTIPDKFKGVMWQSLYDSVYDVPIRKIG